MYSSNQNENNKPRYSLLKNTTYGLRGLWVTFKNEMSFKLELLATIPILFLIYIIEFTLVEKSLLLITLFLILIVELLNSAIESVVDITTKEYNLLAKNAKDMGAGAVFVSIFLHIMCWAVLFFNYQDVL
jgi:diacylglycerol kinase (ATP)